MPRSVFLGRVVLKGEPEWLDEDRSWALALTSYEDDQCPGCGQPVSETTLMRNGRHVHTYEVDAPDVCAGCAALNAELPEWQEDERGTALKFHVKKKPPE